MQAKSESLVKALSVMQNVYESWVFGVKARRSLLSFSQTGLLHYLQRANRMSCNAADSIVRAILLTNVH